jgi:hypothetical protein
MDVSGHKQNIEFHLLHRLIRMLFVQFFLLDTPELIIPDQCEPLIPIHSEPLFRTKVNHLLKLNNKINQG